MLRESARTCGDIASSAGRRSSQYLSTMRLTCSAPAAALPGAAGLGAGGPPQPISAASASPQGNIQENPLIADYMPTGRFIIRVLTAYGRQLCWSELVRVASRSSAALAFRLRA